MTTLIVIAHIVAAVAVAAGNVLGLIATIAARRAASTRTILSLMRLHHRIVMTLLVPGSIVVLVTGTWLTYTAGLAFDTLWIAASLGLWGVSFVIGIFVLVPAETQATHEAQRLVAEDDDGPSVYLRAAVGAPKVWLCEWAELAFVAGLFYLMLERPV